MSRLTPALATAFALVLVAPLATGRPGTSVTTGSPRVHVVYPGQTLAMIAKRYNITLESLCEANGISRRSPIRPKQRLLIPTKDGVVPAAIERSVEPVEPKKDKETAKETAKAASKPSRSKGMLSLQSYTGSFRGKVFKKGKITDGARTSIEKVLAAWRSGQHQPINDRLIRMLVKVSDHFGGKPIRVVSGYRPYSPTQYTPHSRHNTGHAVDFSVVGVSNTVVRDFCRTLPNVGCGYYPNSSFVHMDVREMSVYWVDYSGPGQAPRYANAQGRDPGEAERATQEREEAATGSGDGTHSSDTDFDPDDI